MPRFVIDSSGWLEYFTNGKLANKYATFIEKAGQNNFFTPTVVLYEVYKKLQIERGKSVADKAVVQISSKTTLIQLTDSIALAAAQPSLSKNLKLADAIIKATADDLNAVLITSDSDFRDLSNVNLVQ